jgi:hypothetical protein
MRMAISPRLAISKFFMSPHNQTMVFNVRLPHPYAQVERSILVGTGVNYKPVSRLFQLPFNIRQTFDGRQRIALIRTHVTNHDVCESGLLETREEIHHFVY